MDDEVTLAEVADRDLLEALYGMVADIHEALALDEDEDHDDEGHDDEGHEDEGHEDEREESSTDDHDDEENEENDGEEVREEDLAAATA